MKKLLLLMLVLLGGVMQVSADNYLKGSWNWSGSTTFTFNDDNPSRGFATVYLQANTDYWFRIEDGSSYRNSSEDITENHSANIILYSSDNNDGKITTTIAGEYRFEVIWYKHNDEKYYPHISVIYPKGNQYTVHFKKGDGWTSVYAHRYFNGTEFYNSKWPGTELSPNTNNSDFYDVTFSDNLNRITFSDNGSNTNKSGDVAIDFSSTEYWVTDNATATTTAPANWVGHTRTVTLDKFGTICLPYAATITVATIFKITSYTMDGATLTGINIEPVEGNAIEAGKAYIFKAKSSTLTATYTGGSPSAATEAYGMMGNLSSEKVTVPSGKYIIKDNKIYKAASNVTCGQYKGYITLSGLTTGARGANFISFEDTTTGIANVDVNANIDVDAPMYNLAGQRVSKSYKGVVIVNGKKMLNK